MGLRPTHLGYAYQDLLTAVCLVDLALGHAKSVVVDTKMFTGDRFDDITCDWGSGGRQRLQIKHTEHDRALSVASFTNVKDTRGLRIDRLFSSISRDLASQPDTSHRLMVRDREPEEALALVLRPVTADTDPGPALHGLTSKRFRFDAAALRAHGPWKRLLSEVSDDVLDQACAALVIDTGLPVCSLDIREPGPAEAALLRRVTEELGAGRPPNRNRAPEDVALALIESAKAARSRAGTVTVKDLLPRLGLEVDFGAVREGHPVDRAAEVTRPGALQSMVSAAEETAEPGGVVMVTGAPGIGKSWLCEQLADALDGPWLAVRHHCWLGAADLQRDQRVLTDVVIGSLLQQLEAAAPGAVAQIRPRFAATRETLADAVAAVCAQAPDTRVALIVDGIDHVSRVLGHHSGGAFREKADPAARLVEELAALTLPAGAVLVLASQPGPHLAAVPPEAVRVTVPPLNRSEVESLADRLGVLSALASAVADGVSDERSEAAVALIAERSRGNALYATYLCRQAVGPVSGLGTPLVLGHGGDPLDRLRDVPSSAQDLDDYYDYLLKGLTAEQSHAVGMLAVCDFAVTAEELGEIFPLPGTLLGGALSSVAPIIVQQPGIGGLKIHHESFSRFILRVGGDNAWVELVRAQAAAWLLGRGFFTDARAFRHLPELLAALGRDDEIAGLIGPDFLSRAIAGLQPPAAIVHTLTVAARRAAALKDWPTLVRYIELCRARASYEEEALPSSLAPCADVLVALSGADRVAASLMYEGAPTMPARWGLQLCAAVDQAGCAAPWEAYLAAWDEVREKEQVHYGTEIDDAVFLAELRGRIRLSDRDNEADTAGGSIGVAHRVSRFLDQETVPALESALGILLECVGYPVLLESVGLVGRPDRRAALLLHLADARAGAGEGLPSARTLAVAAWACDPCDPQRLMRHGVAVSDLAREFFDGDLDQVLGKATQEVLFNNATASAGVVSRWLALLAVARAVDAQAPPRQLAQLDGTGFYRAWLRFTLATLGLRGDVEAGNITAEAASTAARVALEQLARHADPFTGRPRACDLWNIHGLVRQVLHEAMAMLRHDDVAPGIASLQTISDRTTTSLMGMAGTGPLTTTDLLSLLAESVGQAGVGVVRELMQQLRDAQVDRRALYGEDADFELEMARVSLACDDVDEAQRCWERAARYMGAYGGHKDATIDELLDPLPQLADADLAQALLRLARTQPLASLVSQCTDGRGTAGTPHQWWRLLARLDPRGAAQLGAQVLLTEPGLPDARVAAAHHQLLDTQGNPADPVVLAVLRIAAGPDGRSIARDVALLTRLAELPDDDPARQRRLLPLLANAIAASYDDQPLIYASQAAGDEPTEALRAAARRCGGEGGPPRQARPAGNTRSRQWSSREQRYNTLAYLRAQQRPELPGGSAGVMAAVRDHSSKAFGDPAGPRWSEQALANAVGWRLLEVASREGYDAAARLLHRVADEMRRRFGSLEVLADIATGLRLRQSVDPGCLGRLAATADLLAYTKIRGGGGWRSFAGSDRPELWQQAHSSDAATAEQGLADQVAQAVADASYSSTIGVSQALVSAFALQPAGSSQTPAATALACWDSAFDVIAHRLPGDARLEGGTYEPAPEPAAQDEIDSALCRLAVATISLPERADKRRALVAATALLAGRPAQAQAALAHVLSFDLGAGPLTWLLAALRDTTPEGPLDAALTDQLLALCGSDFLCVRADAAAVLTRAGHQPPGPPATAAQPALAQAVAAFVGEEDPS